MKKYPNDLIGDIMKAFGKYANRPAFVIEDTACTYGELATCVQKISSLFKDRRQNYRHRRRKQTGNIRIHTICTDLRKGIRHPPSFLPQT